MKHFCFCGTVLYCAKQISNSNNWELHNRHTGNSTKIIVSSIRYRIMDAYQLIDFFKELSIRTKTCLVDYGSHDIYYDYGDMDEIFIRGKDALYYDIHISFDLSDCNSEENKRYFWSLYRKTKKVYEEIMKALQKTDEADI